MVVHDIEVHDIRTGGEDVIDFLPETCKICRQNRGGNFEIGHDRFLGVSVWLASGSKNLKREIYLKRPGIAALKTANFVVYPLVLRDFFR